MLVGFAISAFWLCLKVGLGCLAAYAIVILCVHLRTVSRLNFYEAQGAILYPGCKRFFFGNSHDLAAYGKARQAAEVISGPQQWLVFYNFVRALGHPEEKFTADKFPIVVFNQQGIVNLYVSDPDIAKDVLVAKNALTDKHVDSFLIFE